MKTCSRCKQERSLEEFYRSLASKDGLQNMCKLCNQELGNTPEYREAAKRRYDLKRDLILKKQRDGYHSGKYLYPATRQKWAKENGKKYRMQHTEEISQRNKLWKKKNPDQVKINRRKYEQNPWVKIRQRLRRRILYALRVARVQKRNSTLELTGCSAQELQKYIASKFQPGMTWDALMRGQIHIDHIRPCSSFDLTNLEQQKKCFHYTNLQPLWAKDNIMKSNKYQPEERLLIAA